MVPDAMIIAVTLASLASLAGSWLNLKRSARCCFPLLPQMDVSFWEACMPGRGRSTYSKRQKEISRQEKRREKAARKQQRKLEKESGLSANSADTTTAESLLQRDLGVPESS